MLKNMMPNFGNEKRLPSVGNTPLNSGIDNINQPNIQDMASTSPTDINQQIIPPPSEYQTPVHSLVSQLPDINHTLMTGAPMEQNYKPILQNIFGSADPTQVIDILNQINPSSDYNYGAQAYLNSMYATHGDIWGSPDNYKEINSQLRSIVNNNDAQTLAQNGDEGADPMSMQKPMTDIYKSLRGGGSMALGTDISKTISGFINPIIDSNKEKYFFGGKTLGKNGIDCSGWVAKTTLDAMQNLGNYDMKKMNRILNTSAAEQISTIGKISGVLSNDAIESGQLPDGALIGINTGASFAKNRPLQVSHIAQFFRDENGDPMITMSSKNSIKNGPQILPYPQFLEMYKDKPKYAVNPFALQNVDKIKKA